MVNRRVVLFPLAVCLFVASPLFAITRTWTGATSANWSVASNWSPAGAPSPADALVFPKAAANRAMNNDLPAGTGVGAMSVFDMYVLAGNALTLTGDLSVSGDAFGLGLTMNPNVTLGGPVQISTGVGAYVRFTGDLNPNGQTLSVAGNSTYIHGTLSGTGSIASSSSGGGRLEIAGGGSYSGTIDAALNVFSGSLPNATVTASNLDAVGTLGDLTTTSPGITTGVLAIAGTSAGVLHTKSFRLQGQLNIDLYPPAGSDQLQASGTVTLEGTLQVQIGSGVPAPGQTYVIIDNDGIDPVIGTFTGLPEGAFVSLNGYSFQISYAGGTGNDVVLTAASPNKQWTGAVSANWSNPANWSPQGVPAPGENLLFPKTASNRAMNNDLPAGTSVGAMSFFDMYVLSGNALTLTGDLSVTGDVVGVGLTVNANVKLGGPVQSSPGASYYQPYIRFTGDLNVNGQTLTVAGNTTYIHGSLSGTGSIVGSSPGSRGLQIAAGGNYSGTIDAVLSQFSGSLPNATVTAATLDATGTLGDLTITHPGALEIAGTSAGALQAKSVVLNDQFAIDLYPPASSDQLRVNGTVTLQASLNVRLGSRIPAPGQSYLIIDNDGNDPIVGTFSGLPQGTIFAVNGYSFQISYTGGDGNDVVLTGVMPNKMWTGAISANWSNPANWSPQSIPSAGQTLVFPKGASNRAMNNDLPAGTNVGAMSFFDVYILGGNALTLTGDLNVDGDAAGLGLTINPNVTLGGPVHFVISGTVFPQPYIRFTGDLNMNGQTLVLFGLPAFIHGTLSGTGTIAEGYFRNVFMGGRLQIAGGGSYSGTIGTSLRSFSGSLPNATITAWNLDAVGTVGDLTIVSNIGGDLTPPGPPAVVTGFLSIADTSAGVLHTKSVWLYGQLNVDLYPPASSDQLQATGTVHLIDKLNLQIRSGAPKPGQQYVIIDNDGTDPVVGTFAGLPEGAIVIVDGNSFQISYAGGDGNDVVLRVVVPAAAVLTQSSSASVFGQLVTLSATVTSQSGTPTGTVLFTADGTIIGTAPLLNGVATLGVSTLQTGTHMIVASFHGTGIFADTTANAVSHVVTRAQSAVSVLSNRFNTVYGDTIRLTASVSPVAPAGGIASGNVTFFADGVPLGAGQLSGGAATLETPAIHAGVKLITATYGGDTNFEGSTSSPMQQSVAKAQTEVDARLRNSLVIGERDFVTVLVNVMPGSALVPTGEVSITEGGVNLGTEPLAGGAANFILNPFAAGDHKLVVNFRGDADFEASSANVIQSVILPAVSFHGTRVDEGNSGVTVATIVVSLSAPVQVPVRVSFSTLGGNATEGEDYEKASGVIDFAPGQVTRSIELHIAGDTFPEADETFSVLLSDPMNATIDTPSAVIVIANDDQVPPRRRPSRH